MKIALCNTKSTLKADYILACFRKGLEEHGDQVYVINPDASYNRVDKVLKACDLAVQICYANRWTKTPLKGKFRQYVHSKVIQLKKRMVIIDTGFIKNQTDFEFTTGIGRSKEIPLKFTEQYHNEVHYEVGYDGLKNEANYYSTGSLSDRWEKLQALGAELKPWRTDGEHILILCQTYHGMSTQNIDIFEWYYKVVKEIRSVTNYPIKFRHHPRITKDRKEPVMRSDVYRKRILQKLVGFDNIGFSLRAEEALEKDLDNAVASVNYSSNAGVMSVLCGVPTHVSHKSAMAYPVSAGKMNALLSPTLVDRRQWLNDLAYCQWTCAEMEQGICWHHLRPYALLSPTLKAY